jgi:hypothetical protein
MFYVLSTGPLPGTSPSWGCEAPDPRGGGISACIYQQKRKGRLRKNKTKTPLCFARSQELKTHVRTFCFGEFLVLCIAFSAPSRRAGAVFFQKPLCIAFLGVSHLGEFKNAIKNVIDKKPVDFLFLPLLRASFLFINQRIVYLDLPEVL